jgi:hypothetical protein
LQRKPALFPSCFETLGHLGSRAQESNDYAAT